MRHTECGWDDVVVGCECGRKGITKKSKKQKKGGKTAFHPFNDCSVSFVCAFFFSSLSLPLFPLSSLSCFSRLFPRADFISPVLCICFLHKSLITYFVGRRQSHRLCHHSRNWCWLCAVCVAAVATVAVA